MLRKKEKAKKRKHRTCSKLKNVRTLLLLINKLGIDSLTLIEFKGRKKCKRLFPMLGNRLLMSNEIFLVTLLLHVPPLDYVSYVLNALCSGSFVDVDFNYNVHLFFNILEKSLNLGPHRSIRGT